VCDSFNIARYERFLLLLHEVLNCACTVLVIALYLVNNIQVLIYVLMTFLHDGILFTFVIGIIYAGFLKIIAVIMNHWYNRRLPDDYRVSCCHLANSFTVVTTTELTHL